MESEKRLGLLREIERKYFKGSPPAITKYKRKQTGHVYISDEDLNELLGAKLVEKIPFEQYTKVKLTEIGKKAIYSEQS